MTYFINNKVYKDKVSINKSTNIGIFSNKIRPWFITGFTDAEGSFNIVVSKSTTSNLGWRVQARFIIELHKKDIAILEMIKTYFGEIGKISINTKRESVRFIVVDIKNIIKIIIPHFENYPLQSVKKIDFELWKLCANLMVNRNHLTQEGLEEILSIKSVINLGLSDKLIEAFPQVKKIVRPLYKASDELLYPDWVSGFIEGDGSFYVVLRSKTNQVVPFLSIGLNNRDRSILERIQQYFGGIGSIYSKPLKKEVEWKVFKFSHLIGIISHFNNYPLIGNKHINYVIWNKIVTLMETKEHLTPEGLAKIKTLIRES